MIPIGTDRPQRMIPWTNYLLIAANVVLYLFSHSSPGHPRSPLTQLAPWCSPYLLDPSHLHLYQFLTYQFLHENVAHILFNMLFLYVFGNNLNEKLGHLGYLAFYLTGGVLAGCGQVLTSNSPTLGASGAISAVTGLFLVLLPRTNIRMFVYMLVYWEIPSLYFIVFSILKDFFEPIVLGDTQTAHAAHIAGNIAGILIGLLLLLTHLVQRDHYDMLAMLSRWRRRKQYEALVSGGYDPYGPKWSLRRKGNESAPAENPQIITLRGEIADLIHQQQLAGAAAKYLELRAMDAGQVLPPQDQLDVANQFMTAGEHANAAAAYEGFLRVYTTDHHRDQIILILALIYARYLTNPRRAIELFQSVIPRMHDAHQRKWAEEELAQLTAPSIMPPPPPGAPASPSPR
ncbi:MAG TPA: rhomboid family intramembrane serine protease [Phycisphaerae bacterium]|nr:rhomboid family intramembrane serine protease [Phycisphaerae bacterium]